MPDSVPPLTAIDEEASERSLADDLRQLAEDTLTLAQAELAYQKSRAVFAGSQVKWIALFGVLAAVLVFFALMALTFGLVLALTPLLTAWGATAAVVLGLLLVAGSCVMLMFGRWKRMLQLLSGEDE